jgi:hypothetical protein
VFSRYNIGVLPLFFLKKDLVNGLLAFYKVMDSLFVTNPKVSASKVICFLFNVSINSVKCCCPELCTGFLAF